MDDERAQASARAGDVARRQRRRAHRRSAKRRSKTRSTARACGRARSKTTSGRRRVVENLRIAIDAASRRGEPLEHVLFYGRPGLGKTTLAGLIARELGANFRPTSGPTLEKPKDLVGILTALEDGDVLLHRRDPSPRPRRRRVSLSGDGRFSDRLRRRSRRVRKDAQTAAQALHADRRDDARRACSRAPLRERFGIVHHLDYYEPSRISSRSSRARRGVLGVPIDDGGRADDRRAQPRHAAHREPAVAPRARLRRSARRRRASRREVADEALRREGVDELGLDRLDRAFLRTIVEQYGGGPVGIAAIAATLTEDARDARRRRRAVSAQGRFRDPHGQRPQSDAGRPTATSARRAARTGQEPLL